MGWGQGGGGLLLNFILLLNSKIHQVSLIFLFISIKKKKKKISFQAKHTGLNRRRMSSYAFSLSLLSVNCFFSLYLIIFFIKICKNKIFLFLFFYKFFPPIVADFCLLSKKKEDYMKKIRLFGCVLEKLCVNFFFKINIHFMFKIKK